MMAFKIDVLLTGDATDDDRELARARLDSLRDVLQEHLQNANPEAKKEDYPQLEIRDDTNPNVPEADWRKYLKKAGLPEKIVGRKLVIELTETNFEATVKGCSIDRHIGVTLKVSSFNVEGMIINEVAYYFGDVAHKWLIQFHSEEKPLPSGIPLYPVSVKVAPKEKKESEPKKKEAEIPERLQRLAKTSVFAKCGARGCRGSTAHRLSDATFIVPEWLKKDDRWKWAFDHNSSIGYSLGFPDSAPCCPICECRYTGVVIVLDGTSKHFIAIPVESEQQTAG